MNMEFFVRAPTAAGIKEYRVVAKNESEAIFKVVTLHNVIGWPPQGIVKALTKEQ